MRSALLFLSLLVMSPIGNTQPVKVNVIAVASVQDLSRWLGKPVDPARAEGVGAYPGRLTRLPMGVKTQLPIVVTGLATPATQRIQLVADVEVLGTDGRVLASSPRCCRASIAPGSRQNAALLESTVIVEPEAGHRQGSYTVRVSVTDGAQTWTATEVLPYGELDVPGSAHEAPRLRMNLPPGADESGGPGDKRDCLAMPTPAEVIKCSEKGLRR